jgi:1,4-dihydroxy-2-naphthoate octaprenyltransferase
MGRFRFLAGGLVVYAIGAVLGARGHRVDARAYLLGQAAVTAIQLMTHYVNDYFDLDADRANRTPTRWSGGSRVLPRGELTPRVALEAGVALGGVALLLIVWIVLGAETSKGTALLLVAALLLSWQYSAPPLQLHARALGPLTAACVVGGLTPLVGFGMQAPEWALAPLLAVVPLMMAQFAMIVVLDVPDMVGDAKVGKETIVVRLGRARSTMLAATVVLGTYAVTPLLGALGLEPRLSWGVLVSLPCGGWLVWTLLFGRWRRDGDFGPLTWRAVLWFAMLSTGELAGALLARRAAP